MVDALVTAFTDVSNQSLQAITAIIPLALGIVGALLVVKIGVRAFKSIAGK